MNEQTYERPGTVTAIAVITLVSGIINVLWGLIAGFSFGVTIVFLCIVPLFIAQLVLGIYEIVYASKLLYTPPQPAQPAKNIAVLEIVAILTGNLISVVVGILALVFYNDPVVIAWFAQINGQPAPAPAAPAAPVLPVTPEPPAEMPAKKPRRKVAGE